MSTVIALYGQSCSLKSDIAREISRLTGYKVKHPGEAITTRAKARGKTSGNDVDDGYHRQVDQDTVRYITASLDPIIIMESSQLNFVVNELVDVFRVEVKSTQEIRESRWARRKETGGGRTRQIGENLSERDLNDAQLQRRLYGTEALTKQPNLVVDSTDRSAEDCAEEVWEAFEGKPIDRRHSTSAGKPAMDKKQTKGIRPGPSSGTVRVYSVHRNPFGGYIDDQTSGKGVYVHKSAVETAGFPGLEKDQKLSYVIEEDGVGGFRAVDLEKLSGLE